MKHLSVDEMFRFVSLRKLDKEALELCTVVNSHIGHCDQCRRMVSAFQTVFDQLAGRSTEGEMWESLDLEAFAEAEVWGNFDGSR